MRRLASLALLLTGCATLTGPKTAHLSVYSEPPGADVRVDGQPVARAPTSLELDKSRQQSVDVVAAGYAVAPCNTHMSPGTGYVVADAALCLFLFPIGCISLIDVTGAWNELDQPNCSVQLYPQQAYAPQPYAPQQPYPPTGYPQQPSYPPPQPAYPPPPPPQAAPTSTPPKR